jgi:hypothetical protein
MGETMKNKILEWICIELEGVCDPSTCPCSTKLKLSRMLDSYRDSIVDSAPGLDMMIPEKTEPKEGRKQLIGWNAACKEVEAWKKEKKEGG